MRVAMAHDADDTIAAAVEQALRDDLAHHDQPREALVRIAEEIFTAMDRLPVAKDAASVEAIAVVRSTFGAVLEKLWRDYGDDDLAPPAKYLVHRAPIVGAQSAWHG
jgi:hypothetical protein